MNRSGRVFILIGSLLYLCACGPAPAERGPAAPSLPALGPGVDGAVTAQNSPPNAVFKTRPRASADGVVRGRPPFDVIFNMCETRDVDPGDELKFLYDFLGDDFFFRDICRSTHTYTEAQLDGTDVLAEVCVSDRQPFDGHTLCQSYFVAAATRVESVTLTATQNGLFSPNVLAFNLGGPSAAGGGTLTVTADSDLNSSSEFITVAATGFNIDLFVTGGVQCGISTTTIALTQAQVEALLGGFTVTPTGSVGSFCGASPITITLTYDAFVG